MSEALPLAANRLAFFVALAFLLTAAAARALAPLALRVGLADLPGGRKQHEGAIPLTGGVAMYAGFAAAALASGLVAGPALALLAALALLVAGGIADDLHEISARAKFLLQLAAALLMTSWAGVQTAQLGDLLGLGPLHLYHWAIPFSVVCALGVINAVNMLDGLDGAAGGVALVASLGLAWAATVQGLGAQAVLLLLLAGAIAGFLAWNLRLPGRTRAAVFMGDAGSMMLGLALCWFSIDLTQGPGRTLAPVACVWLLALPLVDMARVMFVRRLRGAGLFAADREHLHHRLVDRGVPPGVAAWLLIGAGAACATAGLAAWRAGVPDWAMFYAFAALLAAVLGHAGARELKARLEHRP